MKKKALKDFKHIALIQTAFLGDVVLTLPLVQAIKEKHPEAKISFITTPAAASIVRLADAVDNVIVFDKRGGQSGFGGMSFMASSLHDLGVDVVISPHRSLRTTTISKMTRVHTVGFDKNAMSFLYSATVKYKPHQHEIERNLSLLSAFSDTGNVLDNFPDPKITISESDTDKINILLKENGAEDDDKIVVLAPGSVWATKKWTEEGFADLTVLLKNAGYTPVLIGAESDKPICDRIKNKADCLSFAGITSIPQTLALMRKARLAVTNDSAPTHFAGLVRCPTLTIFGATTPIFGFGPVGQYDRVVQNEELKCRPCAIHGQNECPVGTLECMKSISAERVFEECNKSLSATTL